MLFHTCCSVTKLCPALCDPMDWSTSGLLLFHRLSVCSNSFPGVEDAIQPSGPLSPPTVSAFNPSQHQGLLKLQYSANMISMYTVVYCGICFIVVVWNWTLNFSDVCLYMYMWHAYMSIYMHVYVCFNVKYTKTCVCMYACSASLQLGPTLCEPMDWSPPGSSVHGDFPGKNTGVGYHFPPGNLSDPGIKRISLASPAGRPILYRWATGEAHTKHMPMYAILPYVLYTSHSLRTYTSQIFCEGHKLYISYSRKIPCSLPKSASVFDNYMHFYIINAKVDA